MKQPGFKWKVDINGIALAAQRVNVSAQVSEVMVTNTEGEPGNPDFPAVGFGLAARIPDISDGTITITQATFDDLSDPFAAPLNLTLGAFYSVVCSPVGRGGKAYRWLNCLLRSFTHDAVIPGGQPVTLVFVPDCIADIELA